MVFKKGELTEEVYKVIMHDLECLELSSSRDNKYHFDLLKGNLEDIFGIGKESKDVMIAEYVICEEEFVQAVGRKPDSREELESFAHFCKKGLEAQIDWGMIVDEAKNWLVVKK